MHRSRIYLNKGKYPCLELAGSCLCVPTCQKYKCLPVVGRNEWCTWEGNLWVGLFVPPFHSWKRHDPTGITLKVDTFVVKPFHWDHPFSRPVVKKLHIQSPSALCLSSRGLYWYGLIGQCQCTWHPGSGPSWNWWSSCYRRQLKAVAVLRFCITLSPMRPLEVAPDPHVWLVGDNETLLWTVIALLIVSKINEPL